MTTAIVEPLAAGSESATPADPPQRESYIDHLRTVLTVQVIVFHCAITYGTLGGRFYYTAKPSEAVSSGLLTMFVLSSRAYFMGLFFLLAGYFTPPSLERKGYGQFIVDRLMRLGLPLLAFCLFLGPLTIAMGQTAQGLDFRRSMLSVWKGMHVENGPLWFTQALLIFSVTYCAYRAMTRTPLSKARREPSPVPQFVWWLASAVMVGVVAVLFRTQYPVGKDALGLQIGSFSSYIFLFALGIAAWRHDWLRKLSWANARWWILALPFLWVLMPIHLSLDRTPDTWSAVTFSKGMPWAAIFWAMWEPFVAWGFIAAILLVFRRYANAKTPLWSWIDRRAYTAYIIHPVVLVGAALLLRSWNALPMIKWACAGSLAVVVCWLVADPLVRMPGLRRIL